ncbi:MAG: hypothetical protein JRI55_07740 [Deltaproteobacteria bacterium]|nr:hypothetical protein [Deltaproteobacteria bacterium]
MPRGRGAMGMPFRPPGDAITVDADLPPDTVLTQIVDGTGTPRAGAQVVLEILRRSVAKGTSSGERRATADDEGLAKLTGLETGSGVSYRVVTRVGPALYSTEPFTLTSQRGLRVKLHAYEWTSDPAAAKVDVAAFAVLDLTEDAIEVDQMLQILTVGAVAWVPKELTVPLPEGFRAFRSAEGMDGTAVSATPDGALRIVGTFAPGQTELRFAYQVPLEGDAAQTLEVALPPRVSRARVIATIGSEAALQVDGFPPARPARSPDGKRVQVTETQLPLGGTGLGAMRIHMAGLPGRGTAHWYALLVAVVLAAAGLSTTWSARRRGRLARAEQADLKDAQAVLLDEIAALDGMRRSRAVSEESYGALRSELTNALARVVRRLDAAQRS